MTFTETDAAMADAIADTSAPDGPPMPEAEPNGDEDAKRPSETPEAYFSRVATRRLNFALRHLYHLENTADTRLGYAYSADQAKLVVNTLQAEVDRLRVLFSTRDQVQVQL